jgi:hypothetical protein
MARDRIGDRPPGLLHQRTARHPAGNREPVAGGHFVGCEEFVHDDRETHTPLMPAKAGIQFFGQNDWVPAFAGTSGK